jgi:hypothetical protein
VVTQNTLANSLFEDELVLAVVTVDHEVPFQCSARVCCTDPLFIASPTVQQSELVTHDTLPSSPPKGKPGVATIDHEEPFQCSASVPPPCPTVQQSELVTQATPPRMLTGLGFGVATIDHDVPFQCSARV